MKLSALFSEGMVLQREAENLIWGYTESGQSVTGTFAGNDFQGTADALGYFEIKLPMPKAGGPYTLTITADETRSIQDVMVGDVFLLGGQSNMELPIGRVMELYGEEMEQTSCEKIRMFEVPKEYKFDAGREELCQGSWILAKGDTLKLFSAVGFFMAQSLQEKTGVPVGLLQTAVGGTPVKAWSSPETIESMGLYTEELHQVQRPNYPKQIEEMEQAREQEWICSCREALAAHSWEETVEELELPGLWKDTSLSEFCGAMVLRKTFTLTKEQAQTPAQLLLGTIVDADVAYINGVEVGRTEYMYPPRIYSIGEGVLQEGLNEITIQLLVFRKNGGFTPEKPYQIRFQNEEMDPVLLTGSWQYQVVKEKELLPQTTFFNYSTAALYLGMLYPIRKWQFLGCLFYQGESNAGDPVNYPKEIEGMLTDWRRLFGKETLPFIYVQLAGFSDARMEDQGTGWAAFRLAQEKSLELSNTAMVTAMDLGEYNDLHPLNKKPLGLRLAKAVRSLIYQEKLMAQSPKGVCAVCGDAQGKLVISFTQTQGGLFAGKVRPGKAEFPMGVELLGGSGSRIGEVEICTGGDSWQPATAVIASDKLIVSVAADQQPKKVRYAYRDCPMEANLYNAEAFPVLPFVLTVEQKEKGQKKETEMEFTWVTEESCAPIVVEETACPGILEIAQKAVGDVEKVTGKGPGLLRELPSQESKVVLFATLHKSPLLQQLLDQGKISQDQMKAVEGKREVFCITLVEKPWQGIEQALVVFGSDKRGTIYGIFQLSEYIGVSPLVFWGDVAVKQKSKLVLTETVQQISKEPSVKYRGFFINDEWPCFGNWTFSHYDGFTAEMYDHVFELLLRLKGNYLWPAMWTSSFALDGPGEENARLADLYGVIMGNSHHEPCLRASEEWDIYKGEDTPYQTAWNYVANKEGLLRYWADGLKRSSKYENIVTIGMRGERDSMMQGVSTLQENIDVLKDIITEQNKLIAQYGDTPQRKLPKLLAVYKEVERYYYGDEETEGLRTWEGLRDTILMFCEDNFGNMRFLPNPEEKQHEGGYGMYYHLDYHGDPISYEWINTTPLSKIWEQMGECYAYGIRDVWMVNVGDLKGNEFPLSYFMDLAYDFERWGACQPDSPRLYTKEWMKTQFGSFVGEKLQGEMAEALTEGIWLSHLKRPEALQSDTYHPAHYQEADRILEATIQLQQKLEEIQKQLPKEACVGFESMIGFPLRMGMNLIQMQIYAGKNAHYAKQGKPVANRYAALTAEAIAKDRKLAEDFALFQNGKWSGMEKESHIGFCKWNEDGCKYPLRMLVEPGNVPKLVVSRADRAEICVKNYGEPEKIVVQDFLYAGTKEVALELANSGIGALECEIKSEACDWLKISAHKVTVKEQEIVTLRVIPEKLPVKEELKRVLIGDGDTQVLVEVLGKRQKWTEKSEKTFLERPEGIVIDAIHYAKLLPGKQGHFVEMQDYGKYKSGMKAYPVTENFPLSEGPGCVYRFAVEKQGDYQLKLLSAPSNPLLPNSRLRVGIQLDQGKVTELATISDAYAAGTTGNPEWSAGVLNQIHETNFSLYLEKGIHELTIYAMEAGFVLERIWILPVWKKIPDSYFGPKESEVML